MDSYSDLKKLFKKNDLLDQALTHRSWMNENQNKRSSNERLEFLGDAVLEFVVSNILFNKFPDKEEGFLTAFRANLVNTKNLSQKAQKLNLGELIYLSKGEEESGGRSNPSLLADTVEAIIGALYIDTGLKTAEKFIVDHVIYDLDDIINKPLKDAKSSLQEAVQALGFPAPKYIVKSESGPDHDKTFVIEVKVRNQPEAKGRGKSKSEAEQNAAAKALLKYANKIQKG